MLGMWLWARPLRMDSNHRFADSFRSKHFWFSWNLLCQLSKNPSRSLPVILVIMEPTGKWRVLLSGNTILPLC